MQCTVHHKAVSHIGVLEKSISFKTQCELLKTRQQRSLGGTGCVAVVSTESPEKVYRRYAAIISRYGGAERKEWFKPKNEQLNPSDKLKLHSRIWQETQSKGKGNDPAPTQQEQGIGVLELKYQPQPQPFNGEEDTWREWSTVFRSWSGRCIDGALAEFYEHLESHRNDPATIKDLELVLRKYDPGLATLQLTCITLDHFNERTGRRQSRMSELIAISYGCTSNSQRSQQSRTWLTRWRHHAVVTYLMDAVTDFDQRVTSWEHDDNCTLSDLITIGAVIKGLEKGGFRDHLVINTDGTTEWKTFVK